MVSETRVENPRAGNLVNITSIREALKLGTRVMLCYYDYYFDYLKGSYNLDHQQGLFLCPKSLFYLLSFQF